MDTNVINSDKVTTGAFWAVGMGCLPLSGYGCASLSQHHNAVQSIRPTRRIVLIEYNTGQQR